MTTFGMAFARFACAFVLLAPSHALAAAKPSIDFNRDIRPILSDNCYACHGPDENKRKASLRLDQKKDAFNELKSGGHAIVPGDLKRSLLVERIVTRDEDDVMPPRDSGKKLSPQQIDLLKRWVASGAAWNDHWSFISPERADVPEVKNRKWPRNEIDRFILARLEREKLKPSPEADRHTLIRRATLDLTGLPPTIEEVDSFLADRNPDAYEKLVDRLLESPHYGERMAVNWLDLARYADTSGYHFDSQRFMWMWREWVINAFNRNMPFDQFTIEQLAGDLLTNSTIEQKIASGFHRNVMTNDEGGADPVEYLTKYIVDRVSTTGQVWLGMTVGCAECHDHKYDPLTQREFYQLYAFFHNVPEKGLDGTRTENPFPRIPIPKPDQASELAELVKALDDADRTLKTREGELPAAQVKWEAELKSKPPPQPASDGLKLHLTFDETLTNSVAADSVLEATLTSTNAPSWADGRIDRALRLDGKTHLEIGAPVNFDRTNAFSYGCWARIEDKSGCLISKMEAGPTYRGFDLLAIDGRIEVHIVSTWPDNAIKVQTKNGVPRDQWLHLMVSYDGSSKASGVRVFVNGRARELEAKNDKLTAAITNSIPLNVGRRVDGFPFTGRVDDVRIYERALSADEVLTLASEPYYAVAGIAPDKRLAPQADELRQFFRDNFATDFRAADQALAAVRKKKDDLMRRIPNTMVMEEMTVPRDTFVLARGNFQQKGEKVAADVPAFLPKLPEGAATNRLGLARWLVAKNHPLAARVTVNRYWQLFFGTGLVKTMNDFGAQGEWPSHPELLDWLACQFRDGGGSVNTKPWDVKALVRLIVTSAAYRQSPRMTKEQLERDPENRLLARGPRQRLDAEFIRDVALATSGLLNRKIGGESVRPYQPPGIWDGTDAKYEQSHGADLYRRGMYVYWRRSAHYPSFAMFDAPNREVCTVQRQRTSTPLQSLVLMNDPVYVEAARALAARIIAEGGKETRARVEFAFRLVLARKPTSTEAGILERTFQQQFENFRQNKTDAEALLAVGESPKPAGVDAAELAAFTAVANVLLNLYEATTR